MLQTKSGASIPIVLCCAGFVSNSLWILYGLVVNDMFVFGLGVFCTTLPLVQIILYFLFNPKRQQQSFSPSVDTFGKEQDVQENKELVDIVVTPSVGPNASTAEFTSDVANFHAVSSPQ